MEVTLLEYRDDHGDADKSGDDVLLTNCNVRPVMTPKMATTTTASAASELTTLGVPSFSHQHNSSDSSSSSSSPATATAAILPAIVSPLCERAIVDESSFFASCPDVIPMEFFWDDDDDEDHGVKENLLCNRRHSNNDPVLFDDDDDDDNEPMNDDDDDNDKLSIHIMPEPFCDCPPILTHSMIRQLLEDGLPPQLKTSRWDRIYAVGRDGDTFHTMLNKCREYKDTILVVQTSEGHVLGGYASCTWQPTQEHFGGSYFGTGQSFLFASHPELSQQHHASMMQEESRQDDEHDRPLSIFKWTGVNMYSQVCDVRAGRLAMGGGNSFGLVLQDNFSRGTTDHCSTFGNPPLVQGGCNFDIVGLEVYGFTSLGAVTTTMKPPPPPPSLFLPALDDYSVCQHLY